MATGTFTATGTSPEYTSKRAAFKAGIFGTFSATVSLEMKDSGGTWRTIGIDNYGTQSTWTVPTGVLEIAETESDRVYRWNCSVFGSGTVTWLLP